MKTFIGKTKEEVLEVAKEEFSSLENEKSIQDRVGSEYFLFYFLSFLLASLLLRSKLRSSFSFSCSLRYASRRSLRSFTTLS